MSPMPRRHCHERIIHANKSSAARADRSSFHARVVKHEVPRRRCYDADDFSYVSVNKRVETRKKLAHQTNVTNFACIVTK